MTIREPFVTVAGQTAPSPGITIIRDGLFIETHNVIVQHHIRAGDTQKKRMGARMALQHRVV